jgi:hypothetical protein
MIRFPVASSSLRLLGLCAARRQRRRHRATAGLEALEARTVLSTTYTLPLVNDTLLKPAQYSIYVGGFSQTSNLSLQPGSKKGVLDFKTQIGMTSSYKVGAASGDFHRIQFDTTQTIDGARIYFYIVPEGKKPPSFSFGQQPADPPVTPYLYSYVELTEIPANFGGRPTIDVSTVDGFSFPVTLSLNNKLGEVGQPLVSPHVNRQTIITEYAGFMKAAAGEGGGNYTVLELPKGHKTDGQSEGLLNPYFYLKEPIANGSLPAHVASPLNTVFDSALNTLFATSGWSLTASDKTTYTVTKGNYQYGTLTNPYTGAPLMLPGIQLQGGANTFHVFNPVGVNVFLGANGQPITATSVSGQLNQIMLTNAPASGVFQKGMFVFGTGFDQTNGAASNYITEISPPGGATIITLKNQLAGPITNFQVVFSQVPDLSIMQLTSGEMVFGNTGFFADAALQGLIGVPKDTLGNIENQIVSAFNRGVAVLAGSSGPLSPSSNGQATQYWGTESNWYPAGQPENLFSWFLHTALIKTDAIFARPPNPAKDNRGNVMGSAYGFGFDEDPGPSPPVPSNQPTVPSKFDPVPEKTTKITVTLDPWT